MAAETEMASIKHIKHIKHIIPHHPFSSPIIPHHTLSYLDHGSRDRDGEHELDGGRGGGRMETQREEEGRLDDGAAETNVTGLQKHNT